MAGRGMDNRGAGLRGFMKNYVYIIIPKGAEILKLFK